MRRSITHRLDRVARRVDPSPGIVFVIIKPGETRESVMAERGLTGRKFRALYIIDLTKGEHDE